MMKFKFLASFFLFALGSITAFAQTAADTWGQTPDLHVEGNHLVDATGKQVMLHGIMDTPSPYFCNYRFTDNHYINVFTDGNNYITKCINYFDNLFKATTTTNTAEIDSWCNVFRLHLDPCWTDNPNKTAAGFNTKSRVNKEGKTEYYTADPHGQEVSGEANIVHFDSERLKTYLTNLYLKIAKKAHDRGMYVIMRPPGVCPNTIQVGDYYQQYLITVWDIVTQHTFVKQNSGWLSIELANEPINITDKSGNKSATAKRDFFQPIVDKIRANGFKGIIWIPGETWQQDYKSYANYPIKDTKIDGYEDEQFGYAVHWYPGWYDTSDTNYDKEKSLKSFLNMVPVAKKKPIMITEVDWSPENTKTDGKYNEWGQWVYGNYGTWGTGSTSKFGEAYKYVIDYLGNCGMTLTHTHDYLDIDYFLSSGISRPAFATYYMKNGQRINYSTVAELGENAWEACSGSCFKWYKEYAHQVHQARDWSQKSTYYFDDNDELKNSAANLNGKVLAVTDEVAENIWYVVNEGSVPQNVKVSSLEGIDDIDYKYLKFNKVTGSGCKATGNIYSIQFCNKSGSTYNIWGENGYFNAQPDGTVLFALGLKSQYGQDGKYYGLWKIDYEEGKGYTFQNVGRLDNNKGAAYVNPASASPQSSKVYVRLFTGIREKQTTAIEETEVSDASNAKVTGIYDIMGHKLNSLQKGINIIRYSNGKTKKILRR